MNLARVEILEGRDDLSCAHCAFSPGLLHLELEVQLLIQLVFTLLVTRWYELCRHQVTLACGLARRHHSVRIHL